MKKYKLLKDSISLKKGAVFCKPKDSVWYMEEGGYSQDLHFTIVENNKEWFEEIKEVQEPKKPWALYPDFQSTITEGVESWAFTLQGAVNSLPQTKEYPFTTSEKIAKRQLAEIQLTAIAEAWNDRVFGPEYWMIGVLEDSGAYNAKKVARPFKHLIIFNSRELASKSLELHKELWDNYYCR